MTRGTGRTTKQIINAPKNAIYLCKTFIEIKMYKEIALENNREDLTFMSCRYFEDKIRGLKKFIVKDHAVEIGVDIDHRLFDLIQFHNNHIRLLND